MKYLLTTFAVLVSLHSASTEGLLPSPKLKIYEFNTDGDPKHFVYIQGGLHGNEFLASEFVVYLKEQLKKKSGPLAALKNYQFTLLPYANPNGTILASRYNANKINLNRNFGMFWSESREKFGDEAFSESETSQIRDILKSKKYTTAIDIHGYINWVVMPSSPDKASRKQKVSDDDKKRFEILEKTLAVNLPSDYQLKKALELGDGGAFEDWAFWTQKIPAFCLEMFDDQRISSQSLSAGFDMVKDFVLNPYQKLAVAKPGTVDQFVLFEKKLAEILIDLSKNTDFNTYVSSKDHSP